MRTTGRVAAAVLIAALAACAPANAKKPTLSGYVIGAPYAAKKRTAVLVVLDARTARRARLESRIGELRLRARKVKVRRGSRIPATRLRVNDRFKARTKVPRGARRASYWQIGLRKLTVTKRSRTLSAAELEELVAKLREDLAKLAEALAAHAQYTAGEFQAVRSDMASLRADMNALRSDLTALSAELAAVSAQLAALETALQAQIDALSDDLAGLEQQLQAVLDDVAALDSAVTALGAQLSALQTDVATLTSDLASLTATVGALSGQLGDLSSLGGTVEALLTGAAPGDVADALDDIAALQSGLAAVQGVVGDANSGLVQQVNGLSAVVGDAGSGLVQAVGDLEAADLTTQADVAALGSAVNAAEGRLEDLELLVGGPGGLMADVASLETTVGDGSSGLVQQVNGLQSDVDVLCGPTSLLNALC